MKLVCRYTALFAILVVTSGHLYAQLSPAETVKAFLEASNAQNGSKAAGLVAAAGPSIIDDIPPYSWTGDSSFSSWMAASAKYAVAQGLSEPHIFFEGFDRNEISGDNAYVVCSAIYQFKQQGSPKKESGRLTVTLHQEPAGWRIVSLAWGGSAPK